MSSALIVYGRPPATPTFDGRITPDNASSFKRLLKDELEKLMHESLAPTLIKPICTIADLDGYLRLHKYDLVVFYGHAFVQTTVGRNTTTSEEILQSSCGRPLHANDWADALARAGIGRTMLAGCNSESFAAQVYLRQPALHAGGLRYQRQDDISGDAAAINYFRIRSQPISWWPRSK
jgi:hypothetical protein